jgi:hypothetical protein
MFVLATGGGDDDWRDGSFTRRDSCAAKKSRTGEESIHGGLLIDLGIGQSSTPDSHCPILFHPERASRRSHERSRRSKIDLDAAEATVMLDYR